MIKLSGVDKFWHYEKANQNFPPKWLLDEIVSENFETNGSFLFRSRGGQMRMHVGHIAFMVGADIYAYHSTEAQRRLDEILLERRTWSHLPRDKETFEAEADRPDLSDDTDEISLRAQGATPPTVRCLKLREDARYAPAKGMPPSIENRNPSELRIDDSYQRSIETNPSQALIARIARNWDWRMCLPLVVSKRLDGSLYVIDGQHRLAAAQRRSDISFLPCCVSVYGDVADEAAMFVAMNRQRRQMNRLDDFHAAQAGGDQDANAVADLIRSVGFTVSRRTGSAAWAPGDVSFTSAIGEIRKKHGEGIAREALQMMADAFPDERLIAGSSIFQALCRIMIAPPEPIDSERLLRALLVFNMKQWAELLKGRKGGDYRAQTIREALQAAYEGVAT